LGLYGKVGPAAAALLAIAIYLFQVALSLLWTSRFRFGPAEWLWRTLTSANSSPCVCGGLKKPKPEIPSATTLASKSCCCG